MGRLQKVLSGSNVCSKTEMIKKDLGSYGSEDRVVQVQRL